MPLTLWRNPWLLVWLCGYNDGLVYSSSHATYLSRHGKYSRRIVVDLIVDSSAPQMAEGHQLSIWVSVVVPWLAALLALVLRLVARRMTKVGLGWDDLFSILAFVSYFTLATRRCLPASV